MAGGGTGGHLFPALALADEFKRLDPSVEIVFIGTERGLESKVVPSRGYKLETLDVEGLKKRSSGAKIRAGLKAAKATIHCYSSLKRLKADGVIGSGGYSSGPVVLAARLLGIKTAIIEQNALPGLTNRLLGKIAGRIYLSFEEAVKFFPSGRTMVTGNPIRRGILRGAVERRRGRGDKRFRIFVFGGSQGATAINAAFLDAAEHLADIWGSLAVIHQSGSDGYKQTEAAYKRKGIKVDLYEFIDDMAGAYGSADLVVCRAGATSIAELSAFGLPSILVPYPFSSDGHQDVNAKAVVDRGGALMIPQHELTGSSLAALIRKLYEDPTLLKTMRDKAKSLAKPKAAETIVGNFKEFIS